MLLPPQVFEQSLFLFIRGKPHRVTGAPLGLPADLPVARGVAAVPVEVALAFRENPKAPIISPFFKKPKTFDDANLAALAPLLHRHPADLLPPPLRRPVHEIAQKSLYKRL